MVRRYLGLLGGFLVLTLARPAAAQQLSTAMGSTLTGAMGTSSTTPSFLSVPMMKPNFTAITTKTTAPTPLFNLSSVMPKFPNLQDTILLRNVFGTGPQAIFRTQPPPPPRKKTTTPPPKKQ